MTSIDGPRTDVTDPVTFTYYPAVDGGYLHTVTNAENQTTTFSNYNGFGKPEQVTDANGVATTFGYDGMGRMTSKTTAGLTTGYTYDNAGRLTRITLSGTREIIYTYTDSNLLESITDNAGTACTGITTRRPVGVCGRIRSGWPGGSICLRMCRIIRSTLLILGA